MMRFVILAFILSVVVFSISTSIVVMFEGLIAEGQLLQALKSIGKWALRISICLAVTFAVMTAFV